MSSPSPNQETQTTTPTGKTINVTGFTNSNTNPTPPQQPQPQTNPGGNIVTRCWQCGTKLTSNEVNVMMQHTQSTGHITYKTDITL